MKDRLGLAFFAFAAVISTLAAWEEPSILAWLAALHNTILAILYAHRRPPREYDRFGLLLGLLAAVLPLAAPYPEHIPPVSLVAGLFGYILVLWSLLALGSRFGIAPADRGLVVHGPYRLVRHPMYLGELILRLALASTAPQPYLAVALFCILVAIQAVRALREEHILSGYSAYAGSVRFRMIPGIW